MTVERWTIEGTAYSESLINVNGRFLKRGEQVKLVTEESYDDHCERVAKLAAWIGRDRREPDKVLAYAQELARLARGVRS